ncbi:MAG: DUF2283 domain-containing protein [Chloroflexota bacterium]|nr:DUF2283 domain-containing protein [Chloroflexota bacterium]MDE2891454.1 DUF2283 domain-containing protein [Chloroflexota bacterium]
MKATYFADTDTLVLQFTEKLVEDYVDVGVGDLMELDADGELVKMTIEHAEARGILPGIEFEKLRGGTVELEQIDGKWVEYEPVKVNT